MPAIDLPSPPRRTRLMSFWLVSSAVSGVLVGILSALLVAPEWIGTGVILALLMAVPGFLWPQFVSRPYQVWNRLARYFARRACLVLIGVCYFVIFVAVGRAGSSLQILRPTFSSSLWLPRGTLTPAAYFHQYDVTVKGFPQTGWVRSYFSWALGSGNVWAVCLLPFLLLLKSLQVDQKSSSFPTNIYTLF
jgi:hypothetical protein